MVDPIPTLPSLTDLRESVNREAYRINPTKWVRDHNGYPWSKQREILESVRDNRRTAVKSCHTAGKSWVAAQAACHWIEAHPPGEAFVVTSAPTGPQVRAILWREIGRMHSKNNLSGRTNQTEWWLDPTGSKEEIVAYGRKPSEFNPDAFQGVHARYVLVIYDEACGIPEPLWNAADSLISNEDSRFLAIGNPVDPNTEFANVCSPGSGWNTIKISAFDTPNFTNEKVPAKLRHELISPIWVEEKLRKWGDTNPMYVSRVLAEFPESTVDGLIPIKWIREAQQRKEPPTLPNELGVDVGGGGDRSVIAHRQGAHVRIIQRDQNPDTMQTCGSVLKQLEETGATVAKVDEIGIGRGVVDRAKEQDKPVLGINVGQAANNPTGFVNLRAEGYWGLREHFQEGTIDIDPDDDDLAAQLVDLKYKRTSAGKIQIESKDEMKRRGKSSPDDADAVMLAFLKPADKPKPVRMVWGRR